MDHSKEEVINPARCAALLRTQTVGRIIYDDEVGAQVRPVNYVMRDNEIRVRSDRRFDDASRVVFEIDHTDTIGEEGWSVIVDGRAFSTPLEAVDDDVPQPWASGDKAWVTTIRIDNIAGRWVKAPHNTSSPDDRGYS